MEFSLCVYLFDIIQRYGIQTVERKKKRTHNKMHTHTRARSYTAQNESKNLQQDVQGRIIMWS